MNINVPSLKMTFLLSNFVDFLHSVVVFIDNHDLMMTDTPAFTFQRQYRYKKINWKSRFDKLITPLSQREEFLALYGSFKTDFFSRASVWLQGLNPPHRPGIDFMSIPKFKSSEFTVLKDAAKCGKCL